MVAIGQTRPSSQLGSNTRATTATSNNTGTLESVAAPQTPLQSGGGNADSSRQSLGHSQAPRSEKVDKAMRQIAKLQKDVQVMTSSTRQAREDLENIVNQTNTILQQTKSVEANVLDLQRQQNAAKEETENLQKQYSSLLQEKETLEAQLQSLRDENTALEKFLKEAQVN